MSNLSFKNTLKNFSINLKLLTFLAIALNFSNSTRQIGVGDLSLAYKSLLHSQSFCKYQRAAIFSDKPVYKTGETAHFSIYFYNLMTKKPLSHCKNNIYNSVSIFDVNDKFIASLQANVIKNNPNFDENELEDFSAVFYSYEIPKDLSGGVFSARISNAGSDEVRFFVMSFANRKAALVGDWNSDFARAGDLLKSKLTFKILTSDPENLGPAKINFKWTDLEAKEIYAGSETLIDGTLQINFRVPPFKSPLIFTGEVSSGNYKAAYKKEFQEPKFSDIVIDFSVGTGKLVKDFANKIYFQAFANSKRTEPVPIKSAKVIKTVRSKTITLIPSLSSDSFGKGVFELSVFESDISGNANFELEVKYEENQLVKYPIVNLQTAQFSPVLLKYKKLYHEAKDRLYIELATFSFEGRLTLFIQNKSQIISQKNFWFESSSEKSASQKRNSVIHLSDIDVNQGGVFTIQLYSHSPDEIKKEDGQDLDDSAKIQKDKDIKNQANIRRPPIIINNRPKGSVNFKGVLLQEFEIFVEPAKIIGTSIKFDKEKYLPGEKVKFGISPLKSCSRCAKIINEDLKAVIFVTDESAFLELEKSRESSSLFTKVFLEKEVLSSSQTLKYSHKYIDHIFNRNSKLEQDELIQRRRNVELLLGNAAQRKFLFDPSVLEKYLKQPYDQEYQSRRNLFEYLLPVESNEIVMPFGREPPMFQMRKNINVVNREINENGGGFEEDVPAFEKESSAAAQNSEANNQSEQFSQEESLKPDTIYHDFKLLKGKGILGEFSLPERITNFSFRAILYTSTGIYGFAEKAFSVRKPLNISADIPLFIFSDEHFKIPVLVENNSSQPIELNFASPKKFSRTVKAHNSISEPFTIDPSKLPLLIKITDSNGKELANYRISPQIIAPGIFLRDSASGFIKTGKSATSLNFLSPHDKELISGNSKLGACYRNGVLSLILETIKQFNRVPCGCFEQASTTTFPIIIALKVLRRLPRTPEIAKLINELTENLKKGIQLLLGYECRGGGFEWFGKDPGHSTLTAYGLWQFIELAKVGEGLFDAGLIGRLGEFLRGQRDGQGGFVIRGGLDALGNPEKLVSDAYIVFVLSASSRDFRKIFAEEFEHLLAVYKKFKAGERNLDSYKLSILGLLFLNSENHGLALEIMGTLAARQSESGEIAQAETSITRSSGSSLAVETTALVLILALDAKGGDFKAVADKCMKFISENLGKVYYQSTQATILSLLAIERYLEKFAPVKAGGISFDVKLNHKVVEKINLSATGALQDDVCIDLSHLLSDIEAKSGEFALSVGPHSADAPEGNFFFEVSYEHYSGLPRSAAKSPLEASISKRENGNVAIYSIKVENLSEKEEGMTIVEFSRPSCYEFNINDIEGMRQKGEIDFYEFRENNRIVVFYFRGMAAKEKRTIAVSLVKRFPLTSCHERAHSIYLYYGKKESILYRKA